MRFLTTLVTLCFSLSTLASTLAFADVAFELRRAVETDNARAVQSLIQSGKVSVDTCLLSPGMKPPGMPILGLAAREGSVRVAEYLVRAKADLNLKNSYDETPLMLAALFNDAGGTDGDPTFQYTKHEKIARLLLDAGADLQNPENYDPLIYSTFNSHIRITRALLDRGARVNSDAVDRKSRVPTALMIASMNGDRASVQLLLERGADPCIQDGWGHDAAYMAKKYDHPHLLPLIECRSR